MQCEKKYGTLSRLREHIEGAHGEARYTCEHCLEKFKWRTGLHRHRKKCPVQHQQTLDDDGSAQYIEKYLT